MPSEECPSPAFYTSTYFQLIPRSTTDRLNNHAKSNIGLDPDLKTINNKDLIMSIKQQKREKQRIRRRDLGTSHVRKGGSGLVKVAFEGPKGKMMDDG